MKMPFISVQANPRKVLEVITATFGESTSPLKIQKKIGSTLIIKGKSGKLQYESGVIEIKPTTNTEQSNVGTPTAFMEFLKSALRNHGISFFL